MQSCPKFVKLSRKISKKKIKFEKKRERGGREEERERGKKRRKSQTTR